MTRAWRKRLWSLFKCQSVSRPDSQPAQHFGFVGRVSGVGCGRWSKLDRREKSQDARKGRGGKGRADGGLGGEGEVR